MDIKVCLGRNPAVRLRVATGDGTRAAFANSSSPARTWRGINEIALSKRLPSM